eukprot:m.397871 g.397871  ORF g.397871 m.397871 type:complete len:528 (+) comp56426_c0_seq1:41-1624(+)
MADAEIETLFKRGSAALQQKQWASAERDLREVLSRSPAHLEAMNALANVLKNGLGKPDEALKMYERALGVDANFWKAHYNIGIHFVTSDKTKALEHLDKAIAANPTFIGSFSAAFKACSTDPALADKALEYLTKCVELDPNNVPNRINLASLLSKKSKHKESRDHYLKVIELNPAKEFAQTTFFNLGTLHSTHLLDYPKARDFYQKSLELNPTHIDTLQNVAHMCAQQLKDFPAAIGYYRTLIQLVPNSALYHNGLGLALLTTSQNLEEAVFHLHKATVLDSSSDEFKTKLESAVQRRPQAPSLLPRRIRDVQHETGSVRFPDLSSVPLLSVEEAARPFLLPQFNHFLAMAQAFVTRAANSKTSAVTTDEAVAIWLYTSASPSADHHAISTTLNAALHSADPSAVQPFLPFLKLFFSGVQKMPKAPNGFHRGTLGDLSAQFTKGAVVEWAGLVSGTLFIDSLENTVFENQAVPRTHFVVSHADAHDIRIFSRYPDDCEIVLLPHKKLKVVSSRKLQNLTIVHLLPSE